MSLRLVSEPHEPAADVSCPSWCTSAVVHDGPCEGNHADLTRPYVPATAGGADECSDQGLVFPAVMAYPARDDEVRGPAHVVVEIASAGRPAAEDLGMRSEEARALASQLLQVADLVDQG